MAPSLPLPFYSPSPSGGSGSSGGLAGTFHNYPEKFPQTRRKAAAFLQHIHAITKKGPRTLVGTIVDTSFFHSQGYVTATTELGVVSVFGVPYGSVVPQMRIFVRQMGGHATNRGYVFDGMAPTLSGLGMSSGCVAYTSSIAGISSAIPTTSNSMNAPALVGSTGYYWHCFFYVPSLPSTLSVLWQYTDVAGTNTLALEYLPNGYLRLRSTQDGHGYISTVPVPPHTVHWVVIQPGLGAGLDFLIDGGTIPSTGLIGASDVPTFTGTSHTYLIDLLSDHAAASPPPLGTWLSKVGWGTSVSGATPVAFSTAIPTSDSELPVSGVSVASLTLLCGDSVGTSILTNSASGASHNVTMNTPYATILATGPY